MNVLIGGGSGFIGKALTKLLESRGDTVTWVTRNPDKVSQKAVSWLLEDLTKAINEHDVVVNLAGVNLFDKRWDDTFKRLIMDSRVDATSACVKAIQQAEDKPSAFVNGSAIGYYGSHNSTLDYTEATPEGHDFLAEACVAWEKAAEPLKDSDVRLVTIRTGVVLGHGSGALEELIKPFNMYVGGPAGSGQQWVSWIHLEDIARLFLEAIDNDQYQGVYNGTSPNPVTNKEQAQSLGRAMKKPCWLKVPEFAIRLILGEVADIVVNGQRVLPTRALEYDFIFKYPMIDAAFENLINGTESS